MLVTLSGSPSGLSIQARDEAGSLGMPVPVALALAPRR
jgi:hypothetical protein